MKELDIPKITGKGYEIQLYHPKVKGETTRHTGKGAKVIQCDNIGEVAQWLARNTWACTYGDNNIANPSVWYNGKPWCRYEYSEVM